MTLTTMSMTVCMMSNRNPCLLTGMMTQNSMDPPLHWIPAAVATEASSKRTESNTRRGPADVGSLNLLLLLVIVEMTFPPQTIMVVIFTTRTETETMPTENRITASEWTR